MLPATFLLGGNRGRVRCVQTRTGMRNGRAQRATALGFTVCSSREQRMSVTHLFELARLAKALPRFGLSNEGLLDDHY